MVLITRTKCDLMDRRKTHEFYVKFKLFDFSYLDIKIIGRGGKK
jgi:hypothetical protein